MNERELQQTIRGSKDVRGMKGSLYEIVRGNYRDGEVGVI